jgi:hypothetical protein
VRSLRSLACTLILLAAAPALGQLPTSELPPELLAHREQAWELAQHAQRADMRGLAARVLRDWLGVAPDDAGFHKALGDRLDPRLRRWGPHPRPATPWEDGEPAAAEALALNRAHQAWRNALVADLSHHAVEAIRPLTRAALIDGLHALGADAPPRVLELRPVTIDPASLQLGWDVEGRVPNWALSFRSGPYELWLVDLDGDGVITPGHDGLALAGGSFAVRVPRRLLLPDGECLLEVLPDERLQLSPQNVGLPARLVYGASALLELRLRAGVPPLLLDLEASRASRQHLDYLAFNRLQSGRDGLAIHDEDPRLPGYTERGAKAGKQSCLYPMVDSLDAAIFDWYATAYHSVPLVSPTTRRVGVSHEHRVAAIYPVDRKPARRPFLHPPPQARHVPTRFNARGELPNPAPGTRFAIGCGFPVFVELPRAHWELPPAEVSLTGPEGPVPGIVSSPATPADPELWPTNSGLLLFVPRSPAGEAGVFVVDRQAVAPALEAVEGQARQGLAVGRRRHAAAGQTPLQLGRDRLAPPARPGPCALSGLAPQPLDLVVDGLDGFFDTGEVGDLLAVDHDLVAQATPALPRQEQVDADPPAATDVERQASAAQRDPGVGRDRGHLGVDPQGERVEGRCPSLDLTQGDRAWLELEARRVVERLLVGPRRLAGRAPLQVEVAGESEQAGQVDQGQVGGVDEVQDQAVGLAGEGSHPPPHALRVEPLGAGRPRHGHAGDLGVVEALGEHAHVGHRAQTALAEQAQHLGPLLSLLLAVHDPGGDAHLAQRLGQPAGVGHGDAEHQRAPIAGQLLDRAGHQGVALLDVDRLGQLLDHEVQPAPAQRGQVGRGGDPVAAHGDQVVVRDHLREAPAVDDLLEHPLEGHAVGPRGGGGEPEQGPLPLRVERPQRAQDALVVVRHGVVALVVDHQAQAPTAQQPLQTRVVERAQRGDHHLDVVGRPPVGLLDRHGAVVTQGASDLVARLLEQLRAVGQHQHLPAGDPGELGKDHRLAGARRQAHHQPPHTALAGGDHRVDRVALVGAEGELRGGHGSVPGRVPRLRTATDAQRR